MRNLHAIFGGGARRRLLVLAVVLCALAPASLLSSARVRTINLTVVNDSGREIRHVYLSPVDQDAWGGDQLNEATIAPGETRSLGVACEQSQLKVIAEDKDGCFLTTVVACGADATWTITSQTAADCGL